MKKQTFFDWIRNPKDPELLEKETLAKEKKEKERKKKEEEEEERKKKKRDDDDLSFMVATICH